MLRFALLIFLTPLVVFAEDPKASESEVSTVWDLTDLFPSVEAWESELNAVADGLPE